MNWKFWTWAGRIRQLERELRVANEDRAHLVRALEKQRMQTKETWRHYSEEVGKRLQSEKQVLELTRQMRGMHRNHHA